MAGRGFPPSGKRSRERDLPVRDVLRADGVVAGFDLPGDVLPVLRENGRVVVDEDGVPVREEWHPQTVRWWENWRRSPQATRMVTAPDWDYLLDTALAHHQLWSSGGKNSERLAEVRLRVACFGATYADRQRLKWEVESPVEEFAVGSGGEVVVFDVERRRRLAEG